MNRIILFLFVFLLFPISNSFGEYQTELGDDMFIFVQSTVRSSDGTLVAYLESSKFTDLNMSGLESLLDFEASLGGDPIITMDGEKFQVIRRVHFQSFDSEGLVSSTIITVNVDDKLPPLARFAHDGYIVVSGDTVETVWTFVRPVA